MKIKQTKDTLRVTIKEDMQTFYYLKSLIDKNFSSKIGKKNKIILFNDPEEQVGRKYFLKVLSRIYARKAKKKLKKIWQVEKAVDKTIKITLQKSNQIQQLIKISVKYHKHSNSVEITTDKKSRLITRGIKNIFRDYKVEYYPSIDKTYIKDIDKEFPKKLQHFLSTKELPGTFLDIKYDENIFDDINEHEIKKNNKNLKRVNILLEDYYKKLHCNCEDPYEKVRQSYLSLVKKYHPDNLTYDNEIILKVYRKKFQEIQQAYKTIKEYHKHIGNVA